jgi:phosphoserine phosphatase
MQYVTTLMAATVQAFPIALADRALKIASSTGGSGCRLHWLGPAACDVFYETDAPESIVAPIEGEIAGREIDSISQAVEGRRKRLLIADMESTLIREEMLDELAELKGIRAEISAITARAMNGEIDFAGALTQRVALLEGLPIAALHDKWREIHLTPGARMLVATMRRAGARTVLVSGGFTIFTAKLREMLEMDADYGNELELDRGALTGRLVPPIRDKSFKLETLVAERTALGLQPEDVMSVGDGANDLPMLLEAGIGFAYHAKPSVRQAARYRVDFCDLSALLYAQGYRREDFAS